MHYLRAMLSQPVRLGGVRAKGRTELVGEGKEKNEYELPLRGLGNAYTMVLGSEPNCFLMANKTARAVNIRPPGS